MAKMFPECLRPNVSSHAEKVLYKAFQAQLSNDFTVFHQVRWQVRDTRSGARDGEADFVIACPNLGILVLEVKGGSIRYDGTSHIWYSNNNEIHDPFHQACNSKYRLRGLLKDPKLKYWRDRWIPIGHAVAFPEHRINGSLRLDAPRDIILDNTQLSVLSNWVKAVMNYYRSQDTARRRNFDANSVKELVKILSSSIISQTVLINNGTEAVFQDLSEQQFRLLDGLSKQRRLAISGCAGSGKTLLALEKARRLNEQEFSVLLTCYSKALAQSLRKSLSGRRNLHVYTFHEICEKLFRQAGILPDKNIPEDKLFDDIYPELLIDAADQLDWHVDAVIVDEGQDFRENWWLALKLLLNDPDNGIFYFFHDDNQNIYDCCDWKPPLEETPFRLTENCRNTQKIHYYALQFYSNQYSTAALGPVGRDVEIHNYTGDTELRNTLGRLLRRLIIDQGCSTKDIVILTTSRKQALQNKLLGQFQVKADPNLSRKEILCNTIKYFKGLESPVVILVETELNDNRNNLLYVGASRARHHLIIVRPNNRFQNNSQLRLAS